jgi:hypothetical protein
MKIINILLCGHMIMFLYGTKDVIMLYCFPFIRIVPYLLSTTSNL